ncbi:MAG: NTP transferase domain-containing protein, partial [Zoogloeaceae bacterium]|nr:NTP transferase domain-containing protein [Zoogloeaceae bacterium]
YILCGGQGTRLRGVIGDTQKAIAEICGQPFIALLLRELREAGVTEAILCAGYRADRLFAMAGKFSAESGIALDIAVESEPLGTGGALLNGLRHRAPPSRYFVLNADTFLAAEAYRQLWAASESSRETMLTVHMADRARFGSVFCDAKGVVTRLLEKGASGPGRVNGGAYVFSRASLADLPPRPCSLERDILPVLMERRTLQSAAYAGNMFDIGTPESLETFRKEYSIRTKP